MKRLLGFIFMLSLLMSMGYSAPAPPVLITGEIVDYNVANIDVIIKNTNSGFTETIQTNHFGEYQYEYLNSLNCNDNIQISILGIMETGKIVCNTNNNPNGFKDDKTGLVFSRFDFSGSCPTCGCQRCDSCCPTCGGSGGGTIIITNCSEDKCDELFPCKECKTCQDCPNCDDYCPDYPDCEVYIGRNYLHSIYRIHRSPYTHEHGEVMPVYQLDENGNWFYIPINER